MIHWFEEVKRDVTDEKIEDEPFSNKMVGSEQLPSTTEGDTVAVDTIADEVAEVAEA